MECCNPDCSNLSSETIVCRNCCMTRYCSESCLKLDWELNHSKHCRPHIYTLEDLQIVSNPNSYKLGRGSYGEVRLITTIKGEKLALKSISKSLIETKIPLKTLYREISIHRSLCHRNIIKLYDHLEDSSNIYLVLEYAEQGNLFTYIKRKRKLTEIEAWNFFTQVCLGINYLHEQQVIHRDIKPENILLGNNDIIKICDFGWCAFGSEERSTFCGTLDYMAPEVLNLDHYSYEVDIWALGVLLYEMLHGHEPFRAKSDRAKCKLILDKNFNFGNGISEEAKSLIRSLLTDAQLRPGIKDILKHEWIRKYAQNPDFEEAYVVSHPDYGDGVITYISGLICEVEFGDTRQEFIINDLIEKCTFKEFKNEEDYRSSASGIGLGKVDREITEKIEENKAESEEKKYENLELSQSALQAKIRELNQLKILLESPMQKPQKRKNSVKKESAFDSLLSGFSCVKR